SSTRDWSSDVCSSDLASLSSAFSAWSNVNQITMLGVGHQVATPEALDQALKALESEARDARAAARSQRCRVTLAGRLAADAARGIGRPSCRGRPEGPR